MGRFATATKLDKYAGMTPAWRQNSLVVGLSGIALISGSFFFPWIASRGPVRVASPSVISLPIVPWLIGFFLIISAIGVFHSARQSTSETHFVSIFAGTTLMILPVITVFALNIISLWISPAFIPSTWRRVLIGVSPSTGVWLSLIGGALVVTSLAGGSDRLVQILRNLGAGLRSRNRTAISLLLTGIGLVLYIASRYQPWVSFNVQYSQSGVERWSIPGYAIPVAGISSLIEITLLVICLLWIALRHSRSVGVALLTVAWAPTTYGVIFATSSFIPSRFTIALPHVILKSMAQWSPQAHRLSNGYVTLPPLSHHVTFSVLHSAGGFEVLAAGVLLLIAGLFSISATHERDSL